MKVTGLISSIGVAVGMLVLAGCDGSDGGGNKATATPVGATATPAATGTAPPPPTPTPQPTQAIPITVPDFSAATFGNPTLVNHTFFPLVPGTALTYLAETEDEVETNVVEVLDATRIVGGVNSRVVRDRVFVDGLLIEDTHDWFAQDDAGNVWYMGEQVDNYEYDDDGELVEITHGGSWETGQDVAGTGSLAIAGIVMKAQPQPRESYRQEYYPGDALDMAYVVRTDAEVEVDGETICESCLQILEWNPLEPDSLEYKFYRSGVGLILEQSLDGDETLELVD